MTNPAILDYSDLPNTRARAKDVGTDLYYTGKLCRAGHLDVRYTSTANCATCARAYSKARHKRVHEEDPDFSRRRHLWQKYGITFEQYQEALTQQNNTCAVCKDDFVGEALVDHCHNTGRIRNLLCRGCNTALGHAKDDPLILRLLADYLEYHQQDDTNAHTIFDRYDKRFRTSSGSEGGDGAS